jgi:hypothetical protein
MQKLRVSFLKIVLINFLGTIATVSLLDKEAFIANRTIVVPTPQIYRQNDEKFVYTTFPIQFKHDLFETELILKNRRHLPSPDIDYPPVKKRQGDEDS